MARLPSLSRKHVLALVIGLLALVVVVLLVRRRRDPNPREKGSIAQSCRFASGEKLAFEVQVSSRIRTQSEALLTRRSRRRAAAPGHRTTLSFKAKLYWRVERPLSSSDGWQIRAALAEVHWRLDNRRVAPEAQRAVTAPFAFEIDRRCRFHALRFAAGHRSETSRMIRQIMDLTEVRLTDRRDRSHWLVRQRDSTGVYLARYVRGRVRDGAIPVDRRMLRYLSTHPPGGVTRAGTKRFDHRNVRPEVLRDRTRSWLAPDGRWIVKQSGHRSLRMKYRGTTFASVQGEHRLRRLAGATLPAGVTKRLTEAHFVDHARPQPARAATRSEPAFSVLRRMTLKHALDRFEALLLRGDQQGRHAAVQFLSRFLQAQPDQAFAVLNHLKTGDLSPQAHPTLFLALEVAGTAQAQRALVGAINDDDLSTANRLRAIVALQDVPRLSTATVDSLLSMARSATLRETRAGRALASASLLALGRVSLRLRGQRDDLVAQIRQELVLRLTDDTDQAGLVVALRAVENSGDSYLLGFVAEVLEQESATVRAQATRSLRRMEDPESNVLLSDQLASDDNASVRSAAAETLVERAKLASNSAANGGSAALLPTKEVVSTAIDCLSFEDHRRVRLQLVTLLGLVGTTQASVRRALIEHFRRERDPKVLVRIGRYVSGQEINRSSPAAVQ